MTLATRTIVEITGFPPPMGAWSFRAELVAEECRRRGRVVVLINIGPSRTLKNPRYVNVRGPLDFLWRVLRLALSGAVIHTHTNAKGVKGTLLALAAQCVALLFGRRSVLTFHAGLRQEYFPRSGRRLVDLLLWLTFRTPRALICNSEAVKRKIVEEYGVAERRVHAIPAFCAAYMETPPAELPAALAGFASAHRPLIVSYVFFFHPEFTVDLMVRAVDRLRAELPDVGLVIMGDTKFSEEHRELIARLGVADRVLITGNLPRPEFLAVLKAGHLYLRTPAGDGVASSVLEALALSTPVVACDNGTRPPGCVLYRPGDLDDMVRAIRHVIANREEVVRGIVPPDGGDTLDAEARVLLAL